jgi:hypothetical protein
MNATVPPVTAGLPVTSAVSVTELLVDEVKDGLRLLVKVVLVELIDELTVSTRDHPPVMLTTSKRESAT